MNNVLLGGKKKESDASPNYNISNNDSSSER